MRIRPVRRSGPPAPPRRNAAFEAGVLAQLDSLYRTALRLTRNGADAEDLVQETVLKALRASDTFDAGTNLRAWLFTILHNSARNRLRDRARDAVLVDSDIVERAAELPAVPGLSAPGETPESLLLRETLAPDLKAAIDDLPDAYRQAVWLRDVEEFSYSEIAEMLSIPPGTVMSRISRGRRMLYERLRHLSPVSLSPAMHNCQSIDALVTPYIDGELAADDQVRVEAHLGLCASCRARVLAERAVRGLIQTSKPELQHDAAPPALRDSCARLAETLSAPDAAPRAAGKARWRSRLAPLALAASLVLVVAGAFVYQLTSRSTTVLAAELAADHVKCFALNQLVAPHQDAATVERSMASGFGWSARLPLQPERMGLELVGARPCLYGEGRVAHIMYRYQGRPVSLFMLPNTVRDESVLKVLGHHCAIWSEGDRTFVLVAREPRADMQRLASFVHAGMR